MFPEVALDTEMLNRMLRALSVRRAPSQSSCGEEALLNYALDLAQEWGNEWLKPTQERLRQSYPQMSQSELDRLDSMARAAMNYGHELVHSMAAKEGANVNQSAWCECVLSRYPWVDERNLKHLYSTGMYYAWKDGVA